MLGSLYNLFYNARTSCVIRTQVAQLAGYPDYLLERAQRIFDVRSAQNEQQQKK